ncbi:MAG TPA: M15 family metallopeptidase [Candidatus Saccharimonadales bacterium]|nr:M15 family metallopeptidase [Candidatus Saccharimonadales bacterium]
MSASSTNNFYRRQPKTRRLSKKIFIILGLLVVVGLIEMAAIAWKLGQKDTEQQGAKLNSGSNSRAAAPSFNKARYPIDKAGSVWVVVNKGRVLPSDYTPDLVVPTIALRLGAGAEESHISANAAVPMGQMFAAAAKAGAPLRIASGYRSYDTQAAIFANEVKSYGLAKAESESAHPGHSEHQTGLAADLEPLDRSCEIADCFADTPAGKWLADNSYKYGFILRYPKGKDGQTGYRYEPWHYRYVGKDLAAEIHKNGQTLEQFFGLPVFTSYPAQSLKLKD